MLNPNNLVVPWDCDFSIGIQITHQITKRLDEKQTNAKLDTPADEPERVNFAHCFIIDHFLFPPFYYPLLYYILENPLKQIISKLQYC